MVDDGRDYDAFISYSRNRSDQDPIEGTDSAFVRALHHELGLLGRRWHRLRRSVHIYLDEASLPPSADLTEELRAALRRSRYLILLLSPRAAASGWVRDELDAWLAEEGGPERLILVHTAGTLELTEDRRGFDPASTALPERLARSHPGVPKWIELPESADRATEDQAAWVAAQVMAKLRGVPVDRVVGEEVEEQRLGRRWLTRIAATLAALLVASLVSLGFFVYQRGQTIIQNDRAESRQGALRAIGLRDLDPAVSRQIAVAAREISETVDARSQVLSAASMPEVTRLKDHVGRAFATAASADGHLVVTGGTEGAVSVWSAADPRAPRRLSQFVADRAGVYALGLSADGHVLAVAGAGGVTVWNLADPEHPVSAGPLPVRFGNGRPLGLALSPDGRTLAVGGEFSEVQVWDVSAAPRLRTKLPVTAVVYALAFNPDGRLLAVADSAGIARTFAVTDDRLTLAGGPFRHRVPVQALAFGADGSSLITAANDGALRVWDLDRGGNPVKLQDETDHRLDTLFAMAVSADGTRVVAGGESGEARVWNLRTRRVEARLPHLQGVHGLAFLGSAGEVTSSDDDGRLRVWHLGGPVLNPNLDRLNSAIWSPNGGMVATAGQDGAVQLWNAADRRHPVPVGAPLVHHTESAQRMAFRPDGQVIAVPSEDGTVDFWDVADPSAARLLGSVTAVEPGASVTSVAFSADGRTVATGGTDRSARLFDVTDPAHPRAIGEPLMDHPGAVFGVALRSDGVLATSGADGATFLYDVKDPEKPQQIGLPMGVENGEGILAVRFSPSGRTLATAGQDGLVWLWNLMDLEHPTVLGQALSNGGQPVIDVGFGADGALATANADGSVWLWDARYDPKPTVTARLVGHTDQAYCASFDPTTRRYLLSCSLDGSAVIWDTNVGAAVRDACAQVGQSLTADEWSANFPDREFAEPCT